jgi:phosphate transport system ATP-binding protein
VTGVNLVNIDPDAISEMGEQKTGVDAAPSGSKADVRDLSFYYGQVQALRRVNLSFAENKITAIIGPSGCGKSTLLRCFNRIHDIYPNIRYEGEIILHPSGTNIIGPDVTPLEMRMRVGMVFQKATTFPKSVFENVAFGLRLHGDPGKRIDEEVERALRSAFLWDEVKDRLKKSAYTLSGGQQQRLCIARVLATTPEILLFDEPTSALDPNATQKIEDLIIRLKEQVTVIIVTHNMQQAARVSDNTAFMYLGELIEFDSTRTIFQSPAQKLTEDYITGHFG